MRPHALLRHALLVLGLRCAFAQIFGTQTLQQFNEPPRQLSQLQQGHILSDVQQHQHRFSIPQSVLNQQQFIVAPPTLTPQNQLFLTQQQYIQQQQLLQPSPPFSTVQTPQQPVQHLTQTSFTPSSTPVDPEKEKQRLKELREKESIIEKHNQFVEKQYNKALEKAQADHAEFLKGQQEEKRKLYQKLYKPTRNQIYRYRQNNPRYIYPEETQLFELAVKKYYEEHPTTTTTTTTTTTPKPEEKEEEIDDDVEDGVLFGNENFSLDEDKKSSRKGKILNQKNSAEIFLSSQSNLYPDNKNKNQQFRPTVLPKIIPIQSLDDLDKLKNQYKTQQIAKDDLIAQLKLAISQGGQEIGKNLTSREISLPNGQKIEIIKTTDPNLLIPDAKKIDSSDLSSLVKDLDLQARASTVSVQTTPTSTTTPKPKIKEIINELGVENFEILKQGKGGLETIDGLPDQKQVTFVLLEEQNDGSFKVQGVKGNGKEAEKAVDVDSILKKIKDGEIKLPPRENNEGTEDVKQKELQKSISFSTTLPTPPSTISTTIRPTQTPTTTSKPTREISFNNHNNILKSVTISPNSFASSEEPSSTTPHLILKTNIGTQFVPSTPSTISTTIKDLLKEASSKSSNFNNFQRIAQEEKSTTTTTTTTTTESYPSSTITIFKTPMDKKNSLGDLGNILKENGLYAMAKYLRQSGLDTILNETGPYTLFAPNDKAFRTLLVQLGGPEKAEEKFKENPRLLSGLLLHHVIPGAFEISALQDEMTGVSLAGTQLRVNQYNMHDEEWNDVKVTTINGAKVLDDKQDIEIPQGIAHGVDRVMFPLPVGDVLQTLQSDRERRFTNFLRAIYSAGLSETLQGPKTLTVFAPTDRAFSGLTPEDLSKMVNDKSLAKELVLRHTSPGTLYTNGMTYYQLRDSFDPDKQITITKTAGKVKVNNNLMATQNIPTTNGVIHAIDYLL